MAEKALARNSKLTPEEKELEEKQRELADMEEELAERELELAEKNARIENFQQEFFRRVGRLYLERDRLKAELAELESRKHPKDKEAKAQAQEARRQAEETADAAREHEKDQSAEPRIPPSESLKALFRKAAKILHPDLTLDPNEKARREAAMKEANRAYSQGDEEALDRILSDWSESPESVPGEGIGAELIRAIRKIAQVKRRLVEITQRLEDLTQSSWCALIGKVEDATEQGRDLLEEMAVDLKEEIEALKKSLIRAEEVATRG